MDAMISKQLPLVQEPNRAVHGQVEKNRWKLFSVVYTIIFGVECINCLFVGSTPTVKSSTIPLIFGCKLKMLDFRSTSLLGLAMSNTVLSLSRTRSQFVAPSWEAKECPKLTQCLLSQLVNETGTWRSYV